LLFNITGAEYSLDVLLPFKIIELNVDVKHQKFNMGIAKNKK